MRDEGIDAWQNQLNNLMAETSKVQDEPASSQSSPKAGPSCSSPEKSAPSSIQDVQRIIQKMRDGGMAEGKIIEHVEERISCLQISKIVCHKLIQSLKFQFLIPISKHISSPQIHSNFKQLITEIQKWCFRSKHSPICEFNRCAMKVSTMKE